MSPLTFTSFADALALISYLTRPMGPFKFRRYAEFAAHVAHTNHIPFSSRSSLVAVRLLTPHWGV